MPANEIIKKSVRLYSNRFGVSLAQFLLVICFTGIGLTLIAAVKTVAFPDLEIGFNAAFIEFLVCAGAIILIQYIILTPYIYGGVWYSLNATEVKIVPSAALFGCYNDFDRAANALKLEALLAARRLPVLIPLFAVSAVDIILTMNIIDFTAGIMPVLAGAGCTLSVFGLFMLYKVFSLRFFPARHIFAENPELPAKEIIARSLALTKGRSNDLASLYLRILPWYIFSLLILPALFVMPIATGCYSYCYKSLRAH